MPNWCDNILDVTGPKDDADELRALVTTDESSFDFEAVVPMPAVVQAAERSTAAETAWALKYGDWADVQWKYGPSRFESREAALRAAREADDWGFHNSQPGDDDDPSDVPRSFDELADAVHECLLTHGHRDCISWADAHWGSKWNACEIGWLTDEDAAGRGSVHAVGFSTAWSPPVPVVVALSARFPRLALRLAYDEPLGGFRGFMAASGGMVIASKREEYCRECESITTIHASDATHYPDAIYVGGEHRTADGLVVIPRSRWANPFALTIADPVAAARMYRKWIEGDPAAAAMLPPGDWRKPTRHEIHSLVGKTLACWCGGKRPCHCRVLADLALGRDDEFDDG